MGSDPKEIEKQELIRKREEIRAIIDIIKILDRQENTSDQIVDILIKPHYKFNRVSIYDNMIAGNASLVLYKLGPTWEEIDNASL